MIRRLPWLALPAAALLLDWWSKTRIVSTMALHETKVIIPGFFNLTYGLNSGAIFGTGSNIPLAWRNVLFAVAGLAAILYFGWEFLRASTPTLHRIALGCILGGALGNGLDRFHHGAVVDFLDFEFWGWHYWTFNVADSFIVCGGILLGIALIRSALKQARSEKAAAS
jgi:signal peptidase II